MIRACIGLICPHSFSEKVADILIAAAEADSQIPTMLIVSTEICQKIKTSSAEQYEPIEVEITPVILCETIIDNVVKRVVAQVFAADRATEHLSVGLEVELLRSVGNSRLGSTEVVFEVLPAEG
jgi:hypothetical protein